MSNDLENRKGLGGAIPEAQHFHNPTTQKDIRVMKNIRDFALEVDNAARDFENRGWKKVVVPFGTKAAQAKAWQNSDPKPDVFRRGTHNIGVQLGHKSGGLVDIDLDCPQAMLLADQFFPELKDAAFGRLRKDGTHVLGHRLVMCPDITEKESVVKKYQFNAADEAEAVKSLNFPKGVLVELRAGQYTGFPPSWYPIDDDKPGPDEKLTWRHRGATALVPEIPVMPFAEIKRMVGLLAFASLCLAAYPIKGGRDEFCLKLAGALIHAGVGPADAGYFIERIAEAANDEEAGRRGEKADRTKMKADDGEQVNGLPAFLEAYGLAACEKTVRKWLGMTAKTNEAKAGKAPADPPDKECSIIMGVDELKDHATLIVRKLREANIPIFRRDIEVLRIHRFPEKTTEGEVTYAANGTVLRPNDWRWIRTEVDSLIDYYTETTSGHRKIHPPLDSIQTLSDRIADLGLPELVGLTHVPTLDRDEPGYDPVTKIYHGYNKGDFPKVPENPTKADAAAAGGRLLHHARAFPWKADVDKAVYAAFLLTAVIRASIAFAPVFGFSARDPRSGKSKLAKCGGWLATGSEPATASFMGNKYNDTQAYWATLSSGAYMILYDNLEVGLPFYNDAIAQGLQSANIRARVLGESRTVLLPTRTLMAVTGNDLTSKKDMVERMLRCEIDPKTDKPGERVFDFDPELEVLRDRASLVVDALTIMRAYQMCGERVKVAKAMGGFEEWSRLVREAVIWLGLGDPLGSIKSLREDDASSDHELTVLAALWPRFKDGAYFTVSQIGTKEHTKRLLLPMCRNGRWEGLGYVLRAMAGKDRGGIVLERVRDEVLGQFKFRLTGKPTEEMMALVEDLDFVATGEGLVVSGSGALAVAEV